MTNEIVQALAVLDERRQSMARAALWEDIFLTREGRALRQKQRNEAAVLDIFVAGAIVAVAAVTAVCCRLFTKSA